MINLLYSLFGFEKSRKGVNIFVVIFIHALCWCLFFLLPLLFYPVRFINYRFPPAEFISKLFLIGLFYLNYYFLLPQFFERRKYLSYFLLVFIAILIVLIQEIIVENGILNRRRVFRGIAIGAAFQRPVTNNFFVFRADSAGSMIFRSDSSASSFPPLPFREPTIFNIPRGVILMSLNRVGSLSFILILLGGMIRLGFSFIKNQSEKKLLENANLNAEVNFLKSQINPHFLFNTLNGIYSLAHNKSNQTEVAILKLSDLMRYVLYESGEEKVALEKDIQYLSNYIDLQRLRLSSKVTIHYQVKGNIEGHQIAPLLLISFIENAFKHGISYTNSSFIQIEIIVFEERLTLFVENPIIETNSFAGGVGLKNVTRRLELLYPGKYSLDIVNNGRMHVVNLKLNLK